MVVAQKKEEYDNMMKEKWEKTYTKTVIKQKSIHEKIQKRAKALNEAVEDLQEKHRKKQ